MAGPIGPSLDGSLLWQATQLATNTALPLCQSGDFPDCVSDDFEQAPTINIELKANTSFSEGFIEQFASSSPKMAIANHPVLIG